MLITRIEPAWSASSVELLRRLPWLPREARPPFAWTRPEVRFALALLRHHTNLWVYRCDQQSSCGDFALVDMSARRPRRAVRVLELKSGQRLRVGARSWQLRRSAEVRDALADLGVVPGWAVCQPVVTGAEAYLRSLCRERPHPAEVP